MARLANHLLDQRRWALRVAGHLSAQAHLGTCVSIPSYYPLYPPGEGMNIDYTRVDHMAMPVSPDILILPGQLRPFVSDVNGTLCINPGHLTKFSTGELTAWRAFRASSCG